MLTIPELDALQKSLSGMSNSEVAALVPKLIAQLREAIVAIGRRPP